MYGTQQAPTQIGEGNTGQFNIACLNRVERMCNRKEEGDVEKYYIAFRYALFFVIASIPKEKRNLILQDFAMLDAQITNINASDKNEQTKAEDIRELKYDFADKHEFYIFEAFSRIGILNISDVGELDFQKHDIEKLRSIARADAGPAKLQAITDVERELPKRD